MNFLILGGFFRVDFPPVNVVVWRRATVDFGEGGDCAGTECDQTPGGRQSL